MPEPTRASRPPTRGVTAIELMVVVAIIGVLVAIAVLSVRNTSQGAGALGYASMVEALLEEARLRAVSARRWQRLTVQADRVVHEEATTQGLAAPTDWEEVRTVPAPSSVTVEAVDSTTHLTAGDSVPEAGTGLDAELLLSPDGSGQAATIFIGDGRDRARVAVFAATAATYVFKEW